MGSRLLTLGLVLFVGLATTVPCFGLAHLKADPINGAQETPPIVTPGMGTGMFLVDTNTNTLFYHITFSGLVGTETGAHIHGFAPPGTPAGVLFGLPLGSPKIGAIVYTNPQEPDILAGLTYVNIHSTFAPGGEIRGQVVVDPITDLVALIDAAQEVPPNASLGQGIGVFDIDTAANTLNFDIRFGNLMGTETGAHIHGPAPPGMNAGVIFGLPLGSPKTGTWNFTEPQQSDILAGLTYVNIHSTFAGGGEIRGQIIPMSPATGVEALPTSSDRMGLVVAPNPIPHGNAALLYRLPASGPVSVMVHDVSGRIVRTLYDRESPGSGILAWDTRDESGSPVAAGVYFARVQSGTEHVTRQLVVLR